MIKSFLKIVSTGKFLHYSLDKMPQANKAPNFGQLNLIYGKNGSGKTTLALILRSLKGDNSLLLQKKSFGTSTNPEIEILMEGVIPSYTFLGDQWNHHFLDLDIFDIHFVTDNIYTGSEIQASHKKKLFEIILGDAGVQLKVDLQKTKLRIQNGQKIIRQTTKELGTHIGNALSVQKFVESAPDPNIGARIVEKEHEYTTAQNFQKILQQAALVELPTLFMPYELEEVRQILQQSIDQISEKYLQIFQAHKKHLDMKGQSEEWLQQGYESAEDNCPFCLRPLEEATEILESYKQYFNESYKTLLSQLGELNRVLLNFNLEAKLLEIENHITSNIPLIDFWKNYLPAPPQLYSLADYIPLLKGAFDNVKAIVQTKMTNPIQAQQTSVVMELEELVAEINKKINGFNQAILTFNNSIELIKTADIPDVVAIEKELKILKVLDKRGLPHIVELCSNLKKYQLGIQILSQRKDKKQLELKAFQTAIFSNYLTKINQYLQTYAPYLTLRNLSSGFQGSSTEPAIKFALHLNGRELTHKKHPTKPSLEFSLSEGDKSTLALAFFLTKLELDPRLSEKIIVFDDPVSSFDRYRLSQMLNDLLRLGKGARQLFFSTHNLRLGEEFWRRANQTNLSCQSYEIGTMGKSGVLKHWKI